MKMAMFSGGLADVTAPRAGESGPPYLILRYQSVIRCKTDTQKFKMKAVQALQRLPSYIRIQRVTRAISIGNVYKKGR